MKLTNKSIMSLAFIQLALIFCIVAFLLLNGTFAWLAVNEDVSTSGMKVDAKTTPNLVIGMTEDELSGENLQFEVSFGNVEALNMIAVTRDESIPDTYLKYLSSHYAIDHTTGNAKEGMTLKFEPVPATSEKVYFVDYTVYIASRFDSVDASSLKASITVPDTVDSDYLYFNAASIDFYVGAVNSEGYRGTTSVSDSLSGESESGVELFPDGNTIPLASDGSIKVIMRCYFDGDLQDPATGHAYITSNTVKADVINIGVTFTATDTVSAQ